MHTSTDKLVITLNVSHGKAQLLYSPVLTDVDTFPLAAPPAEGLAGVLVFPAPARTGTYYLAVKATTPKARYALATRARDRPGPRARGDAVGRFHVFTDEADKPLETNEGKEVPAEAEPGLKGCSGSPPDPKYGHYTGCSHAAHEEKCELQCDDGYALTAPPPRAREARVSAAMQRPTARPLPSASPGERQGVLGQESHF